MNPWTHLYAAARALDSLPVAPNRLADTALTRLIRRRHTVAAGNATWADIEGRRRNDNGTITYLSEDLTLADDATQRRIEHELVPNPVWLPLVRRARHWTTIRVLSGARYTIQRAHRGWGDRDVINLGGYLARHTAELLEHLADTSHGWPCGETYPRPEDWENKLRSVAADLRATDANAVISDALDTWHTLATDASSDPDDIAAAFEHLHNLEAARDDSQRDAMRWVADNLGRLWD